MELVGLQGFIGFFKVQFPKPQITTIKIELGVVKHGKAFYMCAHATNFLMH